MAETGAAVGPVDGDGPDVAGAWLDQHFAVRVVARVVVARPGRLDVVDGVLGGPLVQSAHRRVDLHAASEIELCPRLGVERIVPHHSEYVIAEERRGPGGLADAPGLQGDGRDVQPEWLVRG